MPSSYRGPIVDVDLHHNWKDSAEVLAHLSPEWRELARDEVPRMPRIGVAGLNVPGGLKRRDAARLFAELVEHVTQARYVYTHHWSANVVDSQSGRPALRRCR